MYKILGDTLLIATFQAPPSFHTPERPHRPFRSETADRARRRWLNFAGLML